MGPGHGGGALEQGHAVIGAGDGEAAAAFPARRLAGLGLEIFIELARVANEAGQVLMGAQLADQPGGVPCRAATELALFEEHDFAPTKLGQMIGDGTADDAAADDHRPGLGG